MKSERVLSFSLTILIGALIPVSLLEFAPERAIRAPAERLARLVTISPRPSPFIKRTPFPDLSADITYRFELADGTKKSLEWKDFKEWRQAFAGPHRALVPFYRFSIESTKTNPTLLRTVLERAFCRDSAYRRAFDLDETPKRVSLEQGRPGEIRRFEVEVICPEFR